MNKLKINLFVLFSQDLITQVKKFTSDLLDQTRAGDELAIILNYKTTGDPWMPGEVPTLDRLKYAIDQGQKSVSIQFLKNLFTFHSF